LQKERDLCWTPPLSDDGLRRSPRLKELHDGHKAQSDGKKCSCCKETAQPQSRTKPKTGRSRFDIRLPNLVVDISFSSMNDLLECSDRTFLEILVTELQKVATERCGLPLDEVTAELLLKEDGAEAVDKKRVSK
jgi:hypothetical protein